MRYVNGFSYQKVTLGGIFQHYNFWLTQTPMKKVVLVKNDMSFQQYLRLPDT